MIEGELACEGLFLSIASRTSAFTPWSFARRGRAEAHEPWRFQLPLLPAILRLIEPH